MNKVKFKKVRIYVNDELFIPSHDGYYQAISNKQILVSRFNPLTRKGKLNGCLLTKGATNQSFNAGEKLGKSNTREIEVINKLLDQGYEVYTKGFPDLLVAKTDGKNGEIKFIEIKRRDEFGKRYQNNGVRGANECQKRVHEILRAAGIPVEIVWV